MILPKASVDADAEAVALGALNGEQLGAFERNHTQRFAVHLMGPLKINIGGSPKSFGDVCLETPTLVLLK